AHGSGNAAESGHVFLVVVGDALAANGGEFGDQVVERGPRVWCQTLETARILVEHANFGVGEAGEKSLAERGAVRGCAMAHAETDADGLLALLVGYVHNLGAFKNGEMAGFFALVCELLEGGDAEG